MNGEKIRVLETGICIVTDTNALRKNEKSREIINVIWLADRDSCGAERRDSCGAERMNRK